MQIFNARSVHDFYCEAALKMEHEAALRATSNFFSIPVEAVEDALEAEVAA